jgi:hypothetical protein
LHWCRWWLSHIDRVNGVALFDEADIQHVSSDASLAGLAAVWHNKADAHGDASSVLAAVHAQAVQGEHINAGVLRAILVGLRHLGVRPRVPGGLRIDWVSDSVTAIKVARRGSRSPGLQVLAERIALEALKLGARVNLSHVPGVELRVADAVSRHQHQHNLRAVGGEEVLHEVDVRQVTNAAE